MRKIISLAVWILIIPALALIGYWLYDDQQYEVISLLIALLACLPFFIHFEKRKPNPREMVLVAVFIAIGVVSRIAFATVPGFKPVAALTILVGIAFGPETGFMVGALTAVLSNLYFGQGPWTPFQMFAWGIIGFGAGMIFRRATARKIWFIVSYGILAGIGYSMILDILTVLWVDKTFVLTRYLTIVAASFPTATIWYVISNVVFLLVLSNSTLSKLERIKKKYGLYEMQV
jgi:energy-coupling factor transport system substrate-specific component